MHDEFALLVCHRRLAKVNGSGVSFVSFWLERFSLLPVSERTALFLCKTISLFLRLLLIIALALFVSSVTLPLA